MSKQQRKQKDRQRLTIRRHNGQRAFRYRVPPEVAKDLPSGTTMRLVSFSKEAMETLARRVEPDVTCWLTEQPAKNALEALLLMAEAIYALLQPPELPVPHKEQLEIAHMLAYGYDFAPIWPYSREQMVAAMTPGHPALRPTIPDEELLFVAREVEQRLLIQMREEGIVLRDATQAAMFLVTMIHKVLFDEATVFGADQHEIYHIAKVVVAHHLFSTTWPYRDQVKAALKTLFRLSS